MARVDKTDFNSIVQCNIFVVADIAPKEIQREQHIDLVIKREDIVLAAAPVVTRGARGVFFLNMG